MCLYDITQLFFLVLLRAALAMRAMRAMRAMLAMRAMRAMRAQHLRCALAAASLPASTRVLSRFALFFALRARKGRLCRPDCAPTPYLHHLVPMRVYANFGPDRPSHLAAYSEKHSTSQHNTGQRPC
jgi:hypothetical protein